MGQIESLEEGNFLFHSFCKFLLCFFNLFLPFIKIQYTKHKIHNTILTTYNEGCRKLKIKCMFAFKNFKFFLEEIGKNIKKHLF